MQAERQYSPRTDFVRRFAANIGIQQVRPNKSGREAIKVTLLHALQMHLRSPSTPGTVLASTCEQASGENARKHSASIGSPVVVAFVVGSTVRGLPTGVHPRQWRHHGHLNHAEEICQATPLANSWKLTLPHESNYVIWSPTQPSIHLRHCLNITRNNVTACTLLSLDA